MGWARLDDSFHDHPKLIGLSLEALGLWTKCFTWAHRHHGTGGVSGFLPNGLPETFAGSRGRKLGNELVTARLWDLVEGGWAIHDYEDYLPASERPKSAQDVRNARSEAGKRGANARWGKANEKQDDGKLPSVSHGKTMPPTRPDPTHTRTDQKALVQDKPAPNFESEFAEWWIVYPRKQAKAPALKAFIKVRKTVPLKTLMDGVRAYALLNIGQDKSLIKLPAGWLNDKRWEDEQIVNATRTTTTHQPRECIDHPGYPLPCDKCAREGGGRDF